MSKKCITIVIVGPDGSGKTTLAKSLINSLDLPVNLVKLYELRNPILPSMSEIKSFFMNPFVKEKIPSPAKDNYLIGMTRPYSTLKALLLVIWYSLDYSLANIASILIPSREDFYIYARYSYDFLYQRSYRRLPIWIRRIPSLLSSKPDFIFCIYRNPQVIHEGKPELAIDEIKMQYSICIDELTNRPNFFLINEIHSMSPQSTTDYCVNIIRGANIAF